MVRVFFFVRTEKTGSGSRLFESTATLLVLAMLLPPASCLSLNWRPFV